MLNEKFRAPAAIVIVSIVFALGPHPPGGAVLWPKLVFYFLTSVTFGVMALLTDSILPGLVVHILGDLAFFTLVWPDDSARPLARDTGAYPWFWLHAAQANRIHGPGLSGVRAAGESDRPCERTQFGDLAKSISRVG